MSRTLVALPTGAIVALAHGGRPRARDVVVMCNPPGYAGFIDPDPAVTAEFAVDIACLDPVATGSQAATVSPIAHAGVVADYLDALARPTGLDEPSGRIGLVAWGDGALVATALALARPELVDRIALVGPTYGDGAEPADVDDATPGADDDPTGFERRLRRSVVERERRSGARVEAEDGDALRERWRYVHVGDLDVLTIDADGTAPAQQLVAVWRRVLRHLVPPDAVHHVDEDVLR